MVVALSVLLAFYKPFRLLMKQLSLSRKILWITVAFLCLPWNEWTRQNPCCFEDHWSEWIAHQLLFILSCLTVLEFFPSLPPAIYRQFTRVLRKGSSSRAGYWLPPLIFLAFTWFIGAQWYDSCVLAGDARSHLFQARIFAGGRIYAPEPPVPSAFWGPDDELAMKDHRWFGWYLPGFALLLAAALRLHCLWFLCPILGAITLAIWIAYAKRWHGPETALLLGWLAILSPFLLIMDSTVMVHTPELLFASAAFYLCRLESESPSRKRWPALFMILVAAILVRGFSIVPFLLPALAYTSYRRWISGSKGFALVLLAGIVTGGLLVAGYQWQTTGDPFLPGYNVKIPHSWGFQAIGPKRFGTVHTPMRGLENTSNNLLGLNRWLNGWDSGSLIFILAFLLLRKTSQVWDRILLTGTVILILFYFGYYFQDLLYGPRFLFIAAPMFLLFICRSVVSDEELIIESWRPIGVSLMLLCTVLGILFNFRTFVEKFNPAHYAESDIEKSLRQLKDTKTVLFLGRGIGHEYVNRNDPYLKESPIICVDLGALNTRVLEAFPGFKAKYLQGVFESRGLSLEVVYRITDEPLPAKVSQFSFTRFSMVLHSISSDPYRDCFDVVFNEALNRTGDAQRFLAFLEQREAELSGSSGYKKDFEIGIAEAAQSMLLFQSAVGRNRIRWREYFDIPGFRKHYQSSLDHFLAAGEVGKSARVALLIAQERMDRNHDGTVSDDELLRFLDEKVSVIRL